MIMIPKKRMDGLMKDQTVRVLSELIILRDVFTITTYNAGVYIPLTARCDNASGIRKKAALSQRDRLPFFHFFWYLSDPDQIRSV